MLNLSEIKKISDKQLNGDECFTYNGINTEMTVLEFWRWHFSEIYDLQSKIAEYIVAKALGLREAENVGDWTLFDMKYRNMRIEVKETSFYHAWQTDDEPKSKQRSFGITKAYDNYKDENSELRRQNDIYIFCLNTGETKADSNPLMLEHWEFYVVPTFRIDELCKNGKTISLSRVRKIADKVYYNELKLEVDKQIDLVSTVIAHKFSSNHMSVLKKDKKCGCFYCLKIFDPKEITEWIDNDNEGNKYGTAICPYCGIDSIIGESSGYPITTEFLTKMYEYWFSGGN